MSCARFVVLVYLSALSAVPAVAGEALDLSWLAGSWCARDESGSAEEHWLAERAGLMLGMSRTITPRGAQFEFIRIELDRGGAKYIAQPSGGPAVTFDLIEARPNAVTFGNPLHDFPKRISYSRSGSTLQARIDGGEGSSASRDFSWTACGSLEISPQPR